jgi:uncharacterized protein (DUF1330 family)
MNRAKMGTQVLDLGHPSVVVSFSASTVLWLKARLKAFERGNDMKKGYWAVAYRRVADEATMKNYSALAGAALGLFGARLLVSPTSVVTAHETGLQQTTVVVEFDSYEIALAAYESADYKKALAALGSGVERDFRIAEGA